MAGAHSKIYKPSQNIFGPGVPASGWAWAPWGLAAGWPGLGWPWAGPQQNRTQPSSGPMGPRGRPLFPTVDLFFTFYFLLTLHTYIPRVPSVLGTVKKENMGPIRALFALIWTLHAIASDYAARRREPPSDLTSTMNTQCRQALRLPRNHSDLPRFGIKTSYLPLWKITSHRSRSK